MQSTERKGLYFDIIGRRRWWFALSLVVIGTGLFFLATRGLNPGIDFTGGILLRYSAEKPFPPEGSDERAQLTAEIRDAIDIPGARVQLSELNDILIRAYAADEDEAARVEKKISARLAERLKDKLGKVERKQDIEFIGPVIGHELRIKAAKALFWGNLLILLFIAWRYNFRFGVAAIIALVHDVLVLVGVFAIGQWEINSPFVAAALTVIGYSINDTVVIFDRIRENIGARRRIPDYGAVVNDALMQTLARSINTTLTTLFVLLFLLFFGGETIHIFSLALAVGIFSGAYSSLFTASPIVVAWEEYARRKAQARGEAVPLPTPTPPEQPARPEPAAEALPAGARGEEEVAAEAVAAAEEKEAAVAGAPVATPTTTKPRVSGKKKRRPKKRRKSRRRY